MALRAAPAPHEASLTVLRGGKTPGPKPSRASVMDDARVEAIALCDEVIVAAQRIVNELIGLPVPSMLAIHEATRMAARATRARAELLRLDPDGAA